MLEKNKTASLMHFKRIADYLELGPGTWYRSDGDHLEFLDGDNCLKQSDFGPALTHFR